MSYRVRATDRKNAEEIIGRLEERLSQLKTTQNKLLSIKINPVRFLLVLTPFILLNLLLYMGSLLLPDLLKPFSEVTPLYTADFLINYMITIFILIASAGIVIILLNFYNWMLLPTYIAIGDEIETYKSQK